MTETPAAPQSGALVQFLPIVQRELRVAARQSRTWRRRVLTLLAALAIFSLAWLAAGQGRSLGALGSSVFKSLAFFGLVYALLSGPLATADCLSRERREGTLGLLFLTDLRSYDVVVGKIAASSLDIFLALMAALPLLALPLLAGGITLDQFARLVLALANIMVLSLAMGVFASSLFRSSRAAAGFTLVSLLVLTIGLPILGEQVLKIPTRGWVAGYVYSVCPLWLIVLCVQPWVTVASGLKYWLAIGGTQGFAWGLLALACLRTARQWRDVPESKFEGWWQARFSKLRARVAGATLAQRRRWLETNPVVWIEGRDRLQGRILAVLIAGAALFWATQHLRSPGQWPTNEAMFFWPAWSHYLLCVWIAVQAPRRLGDDKQSGALELLLCTGLPAAQIRRGLMLVLWRRFGRAMVALMLLDAFLVYAYVSNHQLWWTRGGKEISILCAGATVVFPLQGYAIARVGLYEGLCRGHSLKATFRLIFGLGLLPWVLFAAWLIAVDALRRYFVILRPTKEAFLFGSWAGAHLIVFAVYVGWASWQLRFNFRALAAAAVVPWWRRWRLSRST